jgi:hypothetical protein
MGVVKMHIDKFGGVVTIDEQHPLAIAQRAKAVPVAGVSDEPPAPTGDEESVVEETTGRKSKGRKSRE